MVSEGGDGVKPGGVPEKPTSYLWPSVLVTVVCFAPTGVVAIVKSAGIDHAYLSGDYERAKELSASAKMWLWITFICGFAAWLFAIGYFLMVSGELWS
jgi:hypothetical protein